MTEKHVIKNLFGGIFMNYKKAYLYLFNRMTDLELDEANRRKFDSDKLLMWIRDLQTEAEEIAISR